MYLNLLVTVLCVVLCSGETIISESVGEPNNNPPITGLGILSNGPCGSDTLIPGLSRECQHDFNLYRDAVCHPHILPIPWKNQTSIFQNFWAYKMLDATGKFPDGVFQGNFNALGSYSSCLEIEATPKHGYPWLPNETYTFSGKFGGLSKFYD